ncbi:hypothetical protein GGI06_003998, partial [Coemansia sp. S85]
QRQGSHLPVADASAVAHLHTAANVAGASVGRRRLGCASLDVADGCAQCSARAAQATTATTHV